MHRSHNNFPSSDFIHYIWVKCLGRLASDKRYCLGTDPDPFWFWSGFSVISHSLGASQLHRVHVHLVFLALECGSLTLWLVSWMGMCWVAFDIQGYTVSF